MCPFFISEDLCMEAKTLIHQTYPRITFPITYWKFFYSISKITIQGEGKTYPVSYKPLNSPEHKVQMEGVVGGRGVPIYDTQRYTLSVGKK